MFDTYIEIFWNFVKAFAVGGAICMIAQIVINFTDLTAGKILVMFMLSGVVLQGLGLYQYLVEFAGAAFPCVDSGFGDNAPVDVVIRPEDIMIVGEDIGQIRGVIKSVLFKGVHYEMMIDTGAYTFKVHSTTMQPQGSKVGVNIVPFNIHIMKPMQEDK